MRSLGLGIDPIVSTEARASKESLSMFDDGYPQSGPTQSALQAWKNYL